MSELNDDLLNYELGDDIDDQAFYGADEDELLLSDDDLEKDVTNEEKQQLKEDAEQWVQTQIQDKDKNGHSDPQAPQEQREMSPPLSAPGTTVTGFEVTSTDPVSATGPPTVSTDSVSTSDTASLSATTASKTSHTSQSLLPTPNGSEEIYMSTNTLNADEVSSSCGKEQDTVVVISCSTTTEVSEPPLMYSSQESTGSVVVAEFSDPREDMDEEREVRTNIKTTNERDVDSSENDQLPSKHSPRFVHGKRGGAPLLRTHGIRSGGPFHNQRPLLRFPPHGNFPMVNSPLLSLAATAKTHTLTSLPSALIPGPGQFPTQQQSLNPYTQHIIGPSNGPNAINTNAPNILIPHDPMNPNQPQRLRPQYGFRTGGALMGFRHPNPAAMYTQMAAEFGNGGAPFNPSFGPPRGMFRPDMSSGGGSIMAAGPIVLPGVMRPGIRNQRLPVQALGPHNMGPNFIGGVPSMRPQQPHSSQQPQNVLPAGGMVTSSMSAGPSAGQAPLGMGVTCSPIQRPKVLINPNFKGGVEAAKNKFIEETRFMTSISSHVTHLQSDDELLRQQEEFINQNRQHIEKRRQGLPTSPHGNARRSRSRSRTRSRSRERSYSPHKRNNERIFERDRERDRERERDRDRPGGSSTGVGTGGSGGERDRVGRDHLERGSGVGNNRPNRFRRCNSRDRDYENRNNYGKRRRSASPPSSSNRGGGTTGGRRGNDRDRNDNDEDEETRMYRIEIEKQKALREKLLRDKELKRRKAAEDKLQEDKRVNQSNNEHDYKPLQPHQQQQQIQLMQQQQVDQQKLKPLVVTERKIITLKKRQEMEGGGHNKIQSQHPSLAQQQQQQQITPRKQIPMAKILPETKRTIAEHLAQANTAIIKPVQKKDSSTPTPSPPKQLRRLSSPGDDEVELNYDEDELMLEDEERLLATPTPSPKRTVPSSRTPSPDISTKHASNRSSNATGHSKSSGGNSRSATFGSNNRRVILKNPTKSAESSSNKSRQSNSSGGGSRHRDYSNTNSSSGGSAGGSGNGQSHGHGGSSNSRKGIFDRLENRSKQQQSSNEGNGNRRKGNNGQRIVMK